MNKDPLKNIIIQSVLVMILSISIIELIDGIMTMKFGFSYLSTLVRLLFLILPLFLIMYIPIREGGIFVCIVSLILVHMFFRLLYSDITVEAIIFDFQYTSRSLLLLISIFLFGYILKKEKINFLFKKYFLIQWVVITTAVFLHISIGLGGTSYYAEEGMRLGYTSYFLSGNQIIFLYVVSWWFLVAIRYDKIRDRIILTSISLLIILAIGSRSGVLLIFIMSSLFLYKKIYNKSLTLFILTSLISLCLCFFILIYFTQVMGFLASLFIKFSSEAAPLVQNVNTYGALTALVSKRDILISNALQAIGHYDLREILFGSNFFNYKKILGGYTNTGEFRMVEVDPIDLLGGFGIIGVLIVYLPIVWIFLRLARKKKSFKTLYELNDRMFPAVQGGILISILASSMSGHIFLSPVSIVSVGLILSMAWHLIKSKPVTFVSHHGFRT